MTNADLSTPESQRKTVLRFVGSLSDQSLVSSNKDTRNKYARLIVWLYNQVIFEANEGNPIDWNPNLPELHSSYWKSYSIAPDKLTYWQDWVVVTRKKKNIYMPFPIIYLSHGSEFALLLHRGIKQFFASQARPVQAVFSIMMEFLSANKSSWPASTFQNPGKVWDFFAKFMYFFFKRAESKKLNLEAQKKLWNTFTANIHDCFIASKIWATPYKPLPHVTASDLDPTKSRIKINPDGKQVRTKLITDIPLHITDEQAIQLLFKEINEDLEVVVNWALSETAKLISSRRNRDRLAEKGTPINKTVGSKPLESIGLENVCATFARDGYKFDRTYLDSKFGTDVYRVDLAKLFALPSSADLFPFQCLLVARHPEITHSFFDGLKLYDIRGEMSGFIETTSGHQLIGFKDRKKNKNSEQKIDLTSETENLVKELIKITNPMREYLKLKGDDRWRNLFLSSGRIYAEPTCPEIFSWNNLRLPSSSTGQILAAQFAPHTSLTGAQLFEFLKRVSLSTIRGSRVVSSYIEHNSTLLASLELGHKNYVPNIVARYLPHELLNFIQSRYIRVFQNAIICIALKDSPDILKATKSRSMGELHEFLSAYALKDIPEDVSSREKLAEGNKNQGHAYISVSPSILSVLMSLKIAVETAQESSKKSISAKAQYWARFANTLKREIEAGTDFTLKSHLSEALKNLEPDQMSEIIYDPS
ncbi:hypothetical protein IB256_27725 [Pseudomonas sp. PDM17]|uniref:hypothetical protein n=1 Tax=Pseudomonas sp. PDM17 TaxID=2769285 RepID=UPI001785022C|nr:hypothetical protein [Pseudomonas sp. PDM17]MBD9504599.1 hypothetical protein [Pseudomonas sp. PDM17]